MKKIFVLTVLFLLLQNCVFAAADSSFVTANKMSDVEVYNEDGKFGLKLKNGQNITDADYKILIRVGNTSWIALKKNRYGLMDCDGNFIIEPRYRHVERVFGKYVKLGNDNDYGLYDEAGNVIIPPEYSSIEPLFGEMFLTCKNYKYGITDTNGEVLLKNDFDDIYMPTPKIMRIQYEGKWYELEKITDKDEVLPEGTRKVRINDTDVKVTDLVVNTGIMSGYSVVTAADYVLKILSSISPAYEDTIDELMFSQGVEGVSVFVKLGWIPRFPFTYIKNYYQNFRAPNNGPLAGVKNNLKRQIK